MLNIGWDIPPNPPDGKTENVVRVFMTRPSTFIFFVQKSESDEVEILYRYVEDADDVHIFTDVGSEEKMWIENRGDEFYIHLHSVREVNGAGWHANKKSGTTFEVE